MSDIEGRTLLRRFKCGDSTLASRLFRLIERGVLPESVRVEINAVLFGQQLMEALRKANERRRARIVTPERVADRLVRGNIPTMVRGGTPPMKRLECPNPGAPDCLETVLRVEFDPAGVRVRAGVVLYEKRESVEVDIIAFTSEAPAAVLWADQYLRNTRRAS